MGGINCGGGGGGGGGNVSPEFSAEYIEQLASYCKSLFDGAAKFFEANVAIEDAVMTGGDLAAAMQLLSGSEEALTSARATLGTVAALWSSIRTPEVDFGEQQKLIAEAASKVAVARLELQMIGAGGSLQQSLWQDPALTSNFVAALESLSQTTSWQGKFAQVFAPANLVAAYYMEGLCMVLNVTIVQLLISMTFLG